MPQSLVHFVYLLSLVVWLGSVIFFSFVTAPALFKNLEKPQAGEILGKIFPVYYKINMACSLTILIALSIASVNPMTPLGFFVLIMLACTFYAALIVHPKVRDLKIKIKEIEDDSKKEALEQKFKSLHFISVMLNSTVLIFGLGVLWITSMHLSSLTSS